MPMRYKARKRLALLVLVFGLPVYIISAITVINWLFPDPLARPALWVEVLIYVGLGILWAFPLRSIFRGIGQENPDT